MAEAREAKKGGEAEGVVQLPAWLPPAIFVALTLVLFAEFVFSDRMLHGDDTLALGYMARAYFAERLAMGEFPLWNPRLLGGIPFIEAIAAGDSIYPTSLLYLLMEPYRALGWKLVLHVLAGGFFMYGWARALGAPRGAATVGGIAWILAPVIVTLVLPGNDGKLMVATLAPLVFWAALATLRSPSFRSGAGLAAAVAATCLTTQFQTSYFLFLSVGAFAAYRAAQSWRSGGWRRAAHVFSVFLGSSVLGAGVAAVQLLPAAQYVVESSRRVDTTVRSTPEESLAYASSWSLHPEEAVSLAVPEFVGNTKADAAWGRGTYWGRNAIKFNHEYLGASVIALALLGLLGRARRSLRWFMAGLGFTWLAFALGAHSPVWRIFYEVVPGISIFRAPSLAAFLVSFAATTLMTLAIADLEERRLASDGLRIGREFRAGIAFAAALLAGLVAHASGALFAFWRSSIFPAASSYHAQTMEAASPHVLAGFAAALLFCGLALLFAWLWAAGKMAPRFALALLAALTALDLGRIDRAFITTLDYDEWASPNANVQFLQERREAEPPFRVADLRSAQNVDLAMFGLDIVTGHHPNDLARYRRLLGLRGSQARGDNTANAKVLRLLGARYLYWPEEAAQGPPYEGAVPASATATPRGREAVYAFPGLPRAWFVGRARPVSSDADAVRELLNTAIDPEREALVVQGEGLPPLRLPAEARDAAAGVEIVDWRPESREFAVESDGPGIVAISENWFEGWRAELNGSPAPVHRLFGAIQGVEIPAAGEHRLSVFFTAPTARAGLIVSLASLLLMALMLAAGPLLARYRLRAPDAG